MIHGNAKLSFIMMDASPVTTRFLESIDGIRMPLLKIRKEKFNKMFIEFDVLMQMINESK